MSAEGRCACGECGGVTLIPVGTVVVIRGKPAPVAAWTTQDHWNLPCVDAEGAVIFSRFHIDAGHGISAAECRRASSRCAELARSAGSPAERTRLMRDSASWLEG